MPPSGRSGQAVADALNSLAGIGAVDEWKALAADGRLSPRDRSVLEQGGIVVRWTAQEARLVVARIGDAAAIADAVLSLLVERHRPLFRRQDPSDASGARHPAKTLAAAS